MMDHGSVFRTEDGLKHGIAGIRGLKERFGRAPVIEQGADLQL